MNQAIRDSCKKPEEAEKGRVEIRPSIPFVSDASYSDLDKDKSKFIEVTCRYTPENADSKKNNYQAHVKTFDHGTPEDVLLWYTKLQEIIKKKPCESPEAMFTLTELLLVGQGQSTFKECRREVCENPVSSTDPTVRGITDESYTLTMEKFKAKAFKKFAARRQVSYLRNNLRKPLAVSIRTCSTRLTEMNNYLRLFPGPDSNVPLGEGDLIDILVRMVPTAWRESMMTANFEPMHHTLLEVVEYFEQLEVIESAKKAREPQKAKKDKSENKEQSKTKPKKNGKKKTSKKKRKREESSSDEDDSKKFCSHCKKNNGPYWTHNTVDCRIKRAAKRRSQNAKELNALVQSEVRKALSKAKSTKKSSGDSSDSESSTGSME